MSVIIRLQNLPWSANAHDIRQYFTGLSIPEGGVHIVGGANGDAFIAFSTDEDARQAFNRNNGKIKDAHVNLLLSSRTEMQKIIEAARNQSMAAFMSAPQSSIVPIMPAVVPSTTSTLSDIRTNKSSHVDKRDTRRRSRSRSRSRSRDRHDRRDKRRDRSRSSSRERTRDRRRRSTSRNRERSRSRERKNSNRQGNNNASTTTSAQPHRVGVWETPPPAALFANATDSANLLASFVANNILPNILNGNSNLTQLAAVQTNLQEHLQQQANNVLFQNQNQNQSALANGFNSKDRPNINPNTRNSRDTREYSRNMPNQDYPENYCIKLFPFFGGINDIKRFFAGSVIANEGILYSKDMFGNRNGQIFVNFKYPECKDEALGRSGDRIRNQVVTIEHVSEDEYRDIFLNQSTQVSNNQNNDNNLHHNRVNERNAFIHLKIEVLPIFANAQDVRNIFCDYPLASVVIEPKGRIKSAYIKFNNPRDAQDALNNTSIHAFEGKPIEVSVCTDAQFESVACECGTDTSQVPTNVVTMSGLPPKCTDRDIVDFFSDIGIMPSKINMIPNDSGFVDEAVCIFYNVDEAILGFQKNGMLFGNGTVSMKYEPINEALTKPQSNARPAPLMARKMSRPKNPLNHPSHQQGNHSNRPHFQNSNQFNGPPMRGPPNMSMQMNNQMPRGAQGRQHMRLQQQQQYPENIGDDDALAPPGCVLLMENVPYKAGVDDILNFFEDFHIPSENVLRKYNANGLPAGEAKVIFNSPEEVYHAIQQNRGRRIRERLIHLIQI